MMLEVAPQALTRSPAPLRLPTEPAMACLCCANGEEIQLPKPRNETQRLNVLRQTKMLDSDVQEEIFTRLALTCARLFKVPIVIIAMVDSDRVWFKAKQGYEAKQISRNAALSAFTVLEETPNVAVCLDTWTEPRFRKLGCVDVEGGLRFYAGAALIVDGMKIGSICLGDPLPRTHFSDLDQELLLGMAEVVSNLIEERRDRILAEERNLAKVVVSVVYRLKTPLAVLMERLQALRALTAAFQVAPLHEAADLVKSIGALTTLFSEQVKGLNDILRASLESSLHMLVADEAEPVEAHTLTELQHQLKESFSEYQALSIEWTDAVGIGATSGPGHGPAAMVSAGFHVAVKTILGFLNYFSCLESSQLTLTAQLVLDCSNGRIAVQLQAPAPLFREPAPSPGDLPRDRFSGLCARTVFSAVELLCHSSLNRINGSMSVDSERGIVRVSTPCVVTPCEVSGRADRE